MSEPKASSSETPLGVSTARCPERSAGTQTAGRLFLAYLILAKQKKVSRPPRRQSGTRTLQSARSFNQKRIRDRAFSRSEPKFARPAARPSGASLRCAAKLRSDPENHNPQSTQQLLPRPMQPHKQTSLTDPQTPTHHPRRLVLQHPKLHHVAQARRQLFDAL